MVASGRLPHGTPGEYAYSQLCRSAEEFAIRLKPFTAGGPLPPASIDLSVGPFRITGSVDSLYRAGTVLFRPTRIKAKDYLRAWIYHLILNHVGSSTDGHRTVLVFDDATLSFRPVENLTGHLENLLNQYFIGLSIPIKFFPESSLAYTYTILSGKDERTALQRARDKWAGFNYPENDDWAYRRCFAHTDPLDSEFVTLAMDILGPILGHRETMT